MIQWRNGSNLWSRATSLSKIVLICHSQQLSDSGFFISTEDADSLDLGP